MTGCGQRPAEGGGDFKTKRFAKRYPKIGSQVILDLKIFLLDSQVTSERQLVDRGQLKGGGHCSPNLPKAEISRENLQNSKCLEKA